MLDPRTKKIARILVYHSVGVKKNDNIIISADTAAKDFALEVYKLVLQCGAHILRVDWSVPNQLKFFYNYAQKHQLQKFPDNVFYETKKADVVFLIRTPENFKELTDISPEKISRRMKIIRPIFD